jgi:P27 family predicted phage terminase small subunit
MAGRPRKPTALHILEGTLRYGATNPLEPMYPVEAPPKPPAVAANEVASEEWDRLMPILLTQGVMTPAYLAAFAAYCSAYADYVGAEVEKSRPGFSRYYEKVSVDGAGVEHVELRSHPALGDSREARKELRQAAQQLGITPATSAKVVALRGNEPKAGIRAFQARTGAHAQAPTAAAAH